MRSFAFAALMTFLLLMPDVHGQGKDGGFGFGAAEGLTVDAAASSSAPGTIQLAVTVTLPSNNYICSQTTPSGKKTEFKLNTPGLTVESITPDRPPKVVKDAVIDVTQEKFYDNVTWTLNLKADDSIKPGQVINGQLVGQYCSERSCLPIRPPAEYQATVPDDYQPAVAAAPAPATPAPAPAATSAADTVTSMEIAPEVLQRGTAIVPVRFTVSLSPSTAKVGEHVQLIVKADVQEPWHVYSLTHPEAVTGQATEINVEQMTGLEYSSDLQSSAQPVTKPDGAEYYEGTISWSRELVVTDAQFSVAGHIHYQLCDQSSCLRPSDAKFKLTAAAVQASSDVASATPNIPGPTNSGEQATGAGQQAAMSMSTFLLLGATAGFLALLTPCVFPMIPVTIGFFLKQEEERPGSALKLASIYCIAIVGAHVSIGILMAVLKGAVNINALATHGPTNLVLAIVFLAFAMMLMGMFEVRMPSWLTNWSSKGESAGGVIGAVFMGLTFTLVGFTCTFPFVGQLLIAAADGEFTRPILGMLAYSTAFAAPFFVFAIFPSLLKALPKSGGWMNSLKVTFGLIELALVVKFLSVADTYFSPTSTPYFLDYHLVMGVWVAIAIVTGLYLLGVFRMPMDSPTDSIGPLRCMFALGFVGLAAYMTIGLFSPTPMEGALWANIESVAPARVEVKGFVTTQEGLEYHLKYEEAITKASESGTPIFVDFTGVDCINCRKMEKAVLHRTDVHDVLKDLVRTQLYIDKIPGLEQGSKDFEQIRALNIDLQDKWYRSQTLPAYAIVTPDGKTILSRTEGVVPAAEFQKFLEDGLRKFEESKKGSASALGTTSIPVSMSSAH